MTELTTNSLIDIMVQCGNSEEYKIGVVFQLQEDLDSAMEEIEAVHDETPIPGVDHIRTITHSIFLRKTTRDYVMTFSNRSTISFITMDTIDSYEGKFNKVLHCGVDTQDWLCVELMRKALVGYTEADCDGKPDCTLDEFLESFNIIDK